MKIRRQRWEILGFVVAIVGGVVAVDVGLWPWLIVGPIIAWVFWNQHRRFEVARQEADLDDRVARTILSEPWRTWSVRAIASEVGELYEDVEASVKRVTDGTIIVVVPYRAGRLTITRVDSAWEQQVYEFLRGRDVADDA